MTGTLVVKILSSEMSSRFTLQDKIEKKNKLFRSFFQKSKNLRSCCLDEKTGKCSWLSSAMESYLLNSHDIPTDYRYIFSWFLHAIYRNNIIITVAYFRAKGIKILGTLPVYELKSFVR